MDARLDPAKYAGLSEGDAHVIRNAGGRAVMTPFAHKISHKLLEQPSGLLFIMVVV
jgi:carbonic anhydrase